MAELSFLPDDYVDRRVERRTNVVCLTLFLIMLSAIAGAYLITNQQRTDVRRQHQQINHEFRKQAMRLAQLEELQDRKKDMIRKARVTAQLVERVPRTLIFSELINNMPNTLSLLNFELETKVIKQRARASTLLEVEKRRKSKDRGKSKNALPEAYVGRERVNMRILGVAPTDVIVAQFMYAIGQCSLFTDVSLSFSEEVVLDQETMRKFQINMKLAEDLNLHQLEPKQVPRFKRDPMAPQLTVGPNG